MKIVILDGYSMNPGDLSWEPLEQLGELTVYPRTKIDELVSRTKNADIILTNDVPLSAETLRELPNCRYICVIATGYNGIDLQQAEKQDIVVSNCPDYSTYSVAQAAAALLLHLTNRVKDHMDAVGSGEWERSEDVTFYTYPLTELYQKNMGIIGLGAIGRQTARIAESLGMQILSYSPRPKQIDELKTLRWVSREELFKQSDVISLHCPLTDETRGMVSREYLQLMKSSSFLINTARGALIVEEDLAWALNTGSIAGAALDVLQEEPPKQGSPLLSASNCYITPHNAWATKEARARLMEIAAENIRAFLDGSPIHVVS